MQNMRFEVVIVHTEASSTVSLFDVTPDYEKNPSRALMYTVTVSTCEPDQSRKRAILDAARHLNWLLDTGQ